MSGFMVNPDPDWRPTLADHFAFRLEMDDQLSEAYSILLEDHKRRIAALESRVAMLEALLLGAEGAR